MSMGIKKSARLKSEYSQLLIPLIAIALLVVFNLIRDPSFFSVGFTTNNQGNTVLAGNLISILNGASELAILAMGMTLVTAAAGGQDISVGAAAAIAGSVFIKVLRAGDITPETVLVAFLASCVVAMLFGAFNGTLVAVFNIQPMIATLILYTAGRSIAYWINGGATPTVSSPLINSIGGFIPGVPIPTPVFIVIICAIIFALLFKFTNLGLYTQVVGINQRAARLNGINTIGIKLLTFVVLGICVAVAGCISVSRLGLINHETLLIEIEMDAILAVAIGGNALSGGRFKMAGSVLGAYAIQALTTTLYAMKVSSTAIKAYKAVVIILIVVIGSPVVKSAASRLWTKLVKLLDRTKAPAITGGGTNMSTKETTSGGIKGRVRREPLTDTNLLLTITIGIFFGMYILAMAVWGGGFLRPQQLFDIFNNNASLIIISCGLTIVMVAGGIDISVGGITALVVMSCVVHLDAGGGSVLSALVIALGIGLAFGLVQGYLVSYLEIQPFIVTLAGMFFARGMTTIVSVEPHTAQNEGFLALKDARIEIPWLGYTAKNGDLIPARIELGVIIALAVVAVVFIILKWSRLGRNLYAVGGNRQSALMLGINVRRTRFFSYLLCGLLSGIGGFVFLMHTGAGNATNAAGAEMNAIASSIIGGTLLSGGVGNVIGTLFGVLTLTTIKSIVVASGLREPWWQSITTGAMLCFFILLQSIVLSNRGKGGFKLAIPKWLRPKNSEQ